MRLFIASSDATSWLLRANIWLTKRHWPDHPPIVVGGYTETPLPSDVEFFKIGEFKDYPVHKWSDGIIRFIQSQPDEIICWTMDDFLFNKDIDNDVVWSCRDLMWTDRTIARIDLTDDRLKSGSAIDAGNVFNVDFVYTPPQTPYLLSFQTGLFRRDKLLQYLVPGETPAQAEIRGADRMSRAGEKVLGTKQIPVSYLIAVQHGKIHLRDSGYQDPSTKLLDEDLAELESLGYLTP